MSLRPVIFVVQVGKATWTSCDPLVSGDTRRHFSLGGVPPRHRQLRVRTRRRTTRSRHRHLPSHPNGGIGRSTRRIPSEGFEGFACTTRSGPDPTDQLRGGSRSVSGLSPRRRNRTQTDRLPRRQHCNTSRDASPSRRQRLRCAVAAFRASDRPSTVTPRVPWIARVGTPIQRCITCRPGRRPRQWLRWSCNDWRLRG